VTVVSLIFQENLRGAARAPPKRSKEPKSRAGVRPIDLSLTVVTALRAHRIARRKSCCGSASVCPTIASWSRASTANRHKLIAKRGLRRIRFHDLHHTHASGV
jgi:hypothetical protein